MQSGCVWVWGGGRRALRRYPYVVRADEVSREDTLDRVEVVTEVGVADPLSHQPPLVPPPPPHLRGTAP